MQIISMLLFAYLLISISCKRPLVPPYDLVISNVTVIDGSGSPAKQHMYVGIRNGIIHKLDTLKIDQRENNIDASGKYLIPGLFDAHAHANSYKEDFKKFIHFGVTSIFMPGGSKASNSYYEAMRSLAKQDSLPAPRVYHTSQHFTMEGRHPVKTYPGGKWIEGETVYYLRDTLQIERIVKKVSHDPIKGIKLTIEDGPSPPFVSRMPQEFVNKVASEAELYGLAVFAHVSDNDELRMALKAGISNIIHFTGVDFDFDKEEQLVDSIIKADISWVTTLMLDKSFIYPLYPNWIQEVEALNVYSNDTAALKDSIKIAEAQEYLNIAANFYQLKTPGFEGIVKPQVYIIKRMYDLGVNMVIGTDTGNTFIFPGYSVHEEMQMMELGGMKPLDIIRMGTLNAAKMLQVADSLGTIEPGKVADMILLDKDPSETIKNTLSIQMVIKNGQVQRRISD